MNAEAFRKSICEISANGRAQGVGESDLADAWSESYTSMNVIGAYFLEEDGYHRGDATDASVVSDAHDRKIGCDIYEAGELEGSLLDALDEEFIEVYREHVYDAIHQEDYYPFCQIS